jgi:hypothetical protein
MLLPGRLVRSPPEMQKLKMLILNSLATDVHAEILDQAIMSG